ncbi:MAG: DMT family transporter [Desmonostoc vinosum HA7617-LM4]|jgi:drug/metabolite transporter (DMT)-like permease|nr:DMT family transporter [Desmonostoc vinosum HA7617-LM4]
MKILNVAELLLLAALWGGSFLFLRMASPVLGPVWLAEIRVLLASLVLLPLLVRLDLLGEMRRHWLSLCVLGCINSAIPFFLLAVASLSLPAGFTSILNATTPLFGGVVAFVWLQENLTISRIIGFALGFAGVLVLVGWKTFAATPAFIMAVGAGLLAALMYAIAAPYTKQQLAGVPSLVVTTGSLFSAAIFLLPAIPFTVPSTTPTPKIILAIIALALLSTALAYIIYFRLIAKVGSTRALTVAYLVPMFAMLWGAIVLGEPITLSMVLGCGLILLGTAIANDLFTNLLRNNR